MTRALLALVLLLVPAAHAGSFEVGDPQPVLRTGRFPIESPVYHPVFVRVDLADGCAPSARAVFSFESASPAVDVEFTPAATVREEDGFRSIAAIHLDRRAPAFETVKVTLVADLEGCGTLGASNDLFLTADYLADVRMEPESARLLVVEGDPFELAVKVSNAGNGVTKVVPALADGVSTLQVVAPAVFDLDVVPAANASKLVVFKGEANAVSRSVVRAVFRSTALQTGLDIPTAADEVEWTITVRGAGLPSTPPAFLLATISALAFVRRRHT